LGAALRGRRSFGIVGELPNPRLTHLLSQADTKTPVLKKLKPSVH